MSLSVEGEHFVPCPLKHFTRSTFYLMNVVEMFYCIYGLLLLLYLVFNLYAPNSICVQLMFYSFDFIYSFKNSWHSNKFSMQELKRLQRSIVCSHVKVLHMMEFSLSNISSIKCFHKLMGTHLQSDLLHINNETHLNSDNFDC